jgi:hypothetical protein
MAIATETLQASVAMPAAIPMGAQVGTRDKTVGWYTPTMDTVDPAVRDLFETYSHIEPGQVIPHILEAVRTILPIALHSISTSPLIHETTTA